MAAKLNSQVETPSGLTFRNRLVKGAMAEGLAVDSDPSDRYISAYTNWGSGGWGGLITGNVDVSTVYRGSPGGIGIALKPTITKATRDAWERWALACQQNGTPTLVQLVHPGRQSPVKGGDRGFFDPSIAPSPIPLKLGDGLLERFMSKALFGTPKQMSLEDIQEVIQQFASAAKLAHEAGFRGVELHGAHGYLLTQFLSPKMNIRTDAYGGTAAKRARIVLEIIRAIRKEVPASFCVGMKINSADVAGSENMEESLEQIRLIASEQIDFLEISGGSYENPLMADGGDAKAMRTAKREAFFLDYAKAVREQHPNLVLMVTGGFRSRAGMIAALESKACDLIGIGRPAAAFPHLPKELYLNDNVSDADAVIELERVRGNWIVRKLPIKMIHAGVDTMYYGKQIEAMGEGRKPQPPPKAA